MPVVTMSSKGQIVLPRAVREALNLRAGSRLEVRVEGNGVILTPVPSPARQDWRRWRGRLAGTQALQEHLAEHTEELRRERLS